MAVSGGGRRGGGSSGGRGGSSGGHRASTMSSGGHRPSSGPKMGSSTRGPSLNTSSRPGAGRNSGMPSLNMGPKPGMGRGSGSPMGVDPHSITDRIVKQVVRDVTRDTARDIARDITSARRNAMYGTSTPPPPVYRDLRNGSSQQNINVYNTTYVESNHGTTTQRSTVQQQTRITTSNNTVNASRSTTRPVASSTSPMWPMFLILLVVIFVFVILVGSLIRSGIGGTSTLVREKIDNPAAWVNDCVTDEMGWINKETQLEKSLRQFYNDTGVQPYILLHAYDADLTTDNAKENWAIDYFTQRNYADNAFLFVYFADSVDDIGDGYMSYVAGNSATTVFDSEAIDIFWNQIDYNWYSDKILDDALLSAFNSTSKAIMHVSTTSKDVIRIAITFVGILLVVVVGGIVLVKIFQSRAAEAEATERVLNTPLEELKNQKKKVKDPLLDKYSD